MKDFPDSKAYVWIDDDIVLTNFAAGDQFSRILETTTASVLVRLVASELTKLADAVSL